MNVRDLFTAHLRIVRDIPYREDGSDDRCRLDIYRKDDDTVKPVVVFFYGGGWRSGDKNMFEHLGRWFALSDTVAVTVNYRLTPEARHPRHAQDCAAAVGWIYRNVGRYTGVPEKIVLSGHSAGAHLASLIATDRHYLNETETPSESICGVAALSGVYDIRLHSIESVLTRTEYVTEAFGTSYDELTSASPASFVRSGLPPFLLICAEHDPIGLIKQSRAFAQALRTNGNVARFVSVKGRDHFSIVRRFGIHNDPTAPAVRRFVAHVTGYALPAARLHRDNEINTGKLHGE